MNWKMSEVEIYFCSKLIIKHIKNIYFFKFETKYKAVTGYLLYIRILGEKFR